MAKFLKEDSQELPEHLQLPIGQNVATSHNQLHQRLGAQASFWVVMHAAKISTMEKTELGVWLRGRVLA